MAEDCFGCARFTNSPPGRLCEKCLKDKQNGFVLKRLFINKANEYQKNLPKIFDSVMLEFGNKKLIDIEPKERQKFITLLERRSPKRYRAIYTGKWREDFAIGGTFKPIPEQYGIIKNEYGLSRK